MTNGSAMMRFSRGFLKFGKGLPVVPSALTVTAPFDIQTHTLNSSFVANLFWFSFLPWVRLDMTVLDPVTVQEVCRCRGHMHNVHDTAVARPLNACQNH